MSRKVVVVGAGLSGLAAGIRLLERDPSIDLTVVDAADRAGGAVGTVELGGFRIERGADGFLTEKTAAIDLATRLGVGDRLIRTSPARDGAYVVFRGALHPLPTGFSMMAPIDLGAFLKSPVISKLGKLRAAAEVLVPRRCPDEDESLGSFVRRRFGDEILERLAQPLAAGIYGADPDKLSLRATMPRFLHEERRMGSVTLGLRERAKRLGVDARGVRYGLFASFDQGMQVLIDAATARLGAHLQLRANVVGLSVGDRISVRVGGETIACDDVILALPGPATSALLGPVDPDLGARIGAIEHGSCATVSMGYDAPVVDARLDGYGFVVPKVEGRACMAATFLSKKWAGRAPAGTELLRVFLPGDPPSDEEAIATAKSELRALAGVTREPVVTRVQRYHRAMPIYEVGHEARVTAIVEAQRARLPRVHLAGNALTGVGIPDAIKAGERAADEVVASARG